MRILPYAHRESRPSEGQLIKRGCSPTLPLVAVGLFVAACTVKAPDEPIAADDAAADTTPQDGGQDATPSPDGEDAPVAVGDDAGAATGSGTPCSTSQDCPDGEMCIGDAGCDAAWTCQAEKPCTRDLQLYCACDGSEFQASGTCPDKPYKNKGPCAG